MIRRMRESDLEDAARLEKRYFSVPWTREQLGESLQSGQYLFLVAEEDGQVAGYAGLLRVMDEGDVTNVVVDEAYRGKGLGTRLMAALLEEGRDCGMKEFTLEVRVSNQRAIRLYESLGFVQEGVRKRFYERPVEDALIMWKRDQGATSNLLFR